MFLVRAQWKGNWFLPRLIVYDWFVVWKWFSYEIAFQLTQISSMYKQKLTSCEKRMIEISSNKKKLKYLPITLSSASNSHT